MDIYKEDALLILGLKRIEAMSLSEAIKEMRCKFWVDSTKSKYSCMLHFTQASCQVKTSSMTSFCCVRKCYAMSTAVKGADEWSYTVLSPRPIRKDISTTAIKSQLLWDN